MAEPRAAVCPHCGNRIETKAQPRTRLRCRQCDKSYLAPPLDATATPPAGPPPPSDAVPPASIESDDLAPGIDVDRVPSLNFPEAPVATPATAEPPPEPEPAPPAPGKPNPEPEPEPHVPVLEDDRNAGRARGARRWRR